MSTIYSAEQIIQILPWTAFYCKVNLCLFKHVRIWPAGTDDLFNQVITPVRQLTDIRHPAIIFYGKYRITSSKYRLSSEKPTLWREAIIQDNASTTAATILPVILMYHDMGHRTRAVNSRRAAPSETRGRSGNIRRLHSWQGGTSVKGVITLQRSASSEHCWWD